MQQVLNEFWIILRAPVALGNIHFPFSIFSLVLEFLLPLVVGILFLRFIRRAVIKAVEQSKFKEENKQMLIRGFKIALRILILLLCILLTTFLMGAELFSVIESLGSILNEPFFKSGDLNLSVMTILSAIPVFYVASWAGRASRTLVESEVLRRIPIDASRRFSIANITRYAVMLLVIIIGLSLIGINLSSLIVIFGVFGIGIGFGLQTMVANFFAGLTIITTRPIKEGDYILASSSGENIEGRVVRITLLHSVVNTLLDETIIIPNSAITQNAVHNYSYDSPEVIIPVSVEVHYESDLDRVEELMLAVGRSCPHRDQNFEPAVRVQNFASSGIEMKLLIRIRMADKRLPAMAWLRKEIWRQFKNGGIVIPYPQVDIHLEGIQPGVVQALRRLVASGEQEAGD